MSTGTQTATGTFVWHDHMSGDAPEAQGFYSKLFGWTYTPFETDRGEYPMITTNGQQHGGFGPAQMGAPPHWIGHVLVDDADAEQLEDRPATAARDAPDERMRRERQIVVREPVERQANGLRSGSRLHACGALRLETPSGERLVDREAQAFVDVAGARDVDGQVEAVELRVEVVGRLAGHNDTDPVQRAPAGRCS